MAYSTKLILVAIAVAAGPIQLVDPLHSMSFSSTSTPFHASSDSLFRCSYTSSYSISTWVKFDLVPAISQSFVTVKSGAQLAIVEKQNDGSVRATVSTECSTITVSLSGPTAPSWSFVALSVCSEGMTRVTLYVVPWQGAQTSTFSDSAEPFLSLSPFTVQVLLGGDSTAMMTVLPTQGQLLNTQFECGVCRPNISSVASSTTCYPKCPGGCSGPGDKSCTDYIQLTDETKATSMNPSAYLSWGINEPPLQGTTFSSNFAFSGWYYETSTTGIWRNLFRTQNIVGDNDLVGRRVMTIFRSNIPYFHYTTDGSTPNVYVNTETLVCFTQPIVLNVWYFVTASTCNGVLRGCYGYFTSASLSCVSIVVPGGTLVFGTSADSRMFIGDPYFDRLDGKIAGQKYYPNTCKTETDLQALFTAGNANLVGCQAYSSPMDCSACADGYYTSAGACLSCNSCCLTCSGPGNSNCLSCSAECTLAAPNVCISTCYSGCPSHCATCTGRKTWNCLTCASGYALLPQNSHMCLSACPSGYSAVAGICTGTNQVILDYQLDQIKSIIDGVNGQKALNGATNTYFPPNFETSDPIPSKQRGYYFSGGQYLQLPPAALASGSPTVLTPSLTFTAWIRPKGTGNRTIYSKKERCIDIFKLRLTASNTLEFVGGYPTNSYAHVQTLTLDAWSFISVTFSFDSSSGQTTISFYYNGVVHATTFSAEFYINDSSLTASQTIGASSDLLDFYSGFIWRVMIRNYVWTTSSSEITAVGCPLGLPFCLSTSPFLQTTEGLACLASCTNGCVRTTDCSYCKDVLCDVCQRFDTNVCITCIANAAYTSVCDCNYGRFFESLTRTCELCASTCNGCSSVTICSAGTGILVNHGGVFGSSFVIPEDPTWIKLPGEPWVWESSDPGTLGTFEFQQKFYIPSWDLEVAPRIFLIIAADEYASVWVNGVQIASGSVNSSTFLSEYELLPYLVGSNYDSPFQENSLIIQVTNSAGSGGLTYKVLMTYH